MKIKPSEKKGGEKRARKEERRVEEDKQGGQRGQLFFFCFLFSLHDSLQHRSNTSSGDTYWTGKNTKTPR